MRLRIKFYLVILCTFFTKFALSEMSLSGYQEFFAGSADQTTYKGASDHGLDKAGLNNGTYTRVTATYSSTLDNGIEINGVTSLTNRDCQGDKTDNCNVVNDNFITFSGSFGSVSVGERFDAGAAMLSRLTAGVPTAEPDGANFQAFYTVDGDNTYGSGNEILYANNSMKILYSSNVYSGFSFAAGYTPNSSNTGLASTNNGQATSGSTWSSYNDVLSAFGKYAMEMDGIGLELVYGVQQGNAGRIGTNDMNDLDETAYSIKLSYGSFEADYRKNEADNSGQIKNGNAGNDEGTSICGMYSFGSIRAGACSVETSFVDTSNQSNSSDLVTYSADYALGGGVTIGLLYFDHEQTANGVTRTDADGVMSMIAIGF